MEDKQNSSNFNLWVSRTRNWVELIVLLGTLLLGAVLPIYQLKQDVALLNQKVDIMVSDNEKRITNLETDQQLLSSQVDRINALVEAQTNAISK
jgi:hypothetical protein